MCLKPSSEASEGESYSEYVCNISLLLILLDAEAIPTFCVPRCECDSRAEYGFCLLWSVQKKKIVVLSVLFLIEKGVLLPTCHQCLLGVLHLFVHIGIVI